MIKDNTVLILGAGASRPYGYPTMENLRIDIINNFAKYYVEYLLNAERQWTSSNSDINEFQKMWEGQANDFINKFNNSHLIIDEFLAQPDNMSYRKIGKVAIACSIVELEKKVSLAKILN